MNGSRHCFETDKVMRSRVGVSQKIAIKTMKVLLHVHPFLVALIIITLPILIAHSEKRHIHVKYKSTNDRIIHD